MTISATFAVSPSPKVMNRIGSSAIGGITAMAVTSGPKLARRGGNDPMTRPTPSADKVAMPSPMPSRHRLASVSAQNRYWPESWSGSNISPAIAAAIAPGSGRILSAGLSAWRAAAAIT